MRTSGEGNDSWLIWATVTVSVIVGVVLAGGPSNALEILNGFLRDVAREITAIVRA